MSARIEKPNWQSVFPKLGTLPIWAIETLEAVEGLLEFEKFNSIMEWLDAAFASSCLQPDEYSYIRDYYLNSRLS